MKKFYIKTEEGVIRAASAEELADEKCQKFAFINGELSPVGQDIVEDDAESASQKAPATTKDDPISELTGLLKEMANQVMDVKEKSNEMEKQLQAQKEWASKGFPLPDVKQGMNWDEVQELVKPYDLARQGQRMVDKAVHPKYVMSEDKRLEFAKYMCLFLKAAVQDDPDSKKLIRQQYGAIDKTVIGDSGNVFPVPDVLMREILHYARESSVILQDARIWDMTSEKMSFPLEGSSVTVGWGNTTSESDPGISETELTCYELSAYTAVRNTTLADAVSDVVSWIGEVMAEAAGLELDNSAFNGDGTSTYAYCSGILSAACGYSVTLGAGSSAFSNLTADALSEMIAKLDGLRKVGAKFYMNGAVLHYVRTLSDTNDRPIFIETVGAPLSGTIWGYPYKEVIKCPSTSAANTAFIAFGNAKHFAIGRRLNSAALGTDPYGLWTTNRTRFKIYQRWALKLALANGFCRLLTAS